MHGTYSLKRKRSGNKQDVGEELSNDQAERMNWGTIKKGGTLSDRLSKKRTEQQARGKGRGIDTQTKELGNTKFWKVERRNHQEKEELGEQIIAIGYLVDKCPRKR